MYERELMAIVCAVQNWRHYLLGQKFIIKTDQRSLKFLMEQQQVNPEHLKWLMKLMGYHFEIQYWSGKDNRATNGLSRVCHTATLMALSLPNLI